MKKRVPSAICKRAKDLFYTPALWVMVDPEGHSHGPFIDKPAGLAGWALLGFRPSHVAIFPKDNA